MTTMNFEGTLFQFFQSNLHTTDSSQVRAELATLWTTSYRRANEDLTPKSIFYINYIARLHGLPCEISPDLIAALKYPEEDDQEGAQRLTLSPLSLLQLAQTLKHCVSRESNFLEYSEGLDAIESLTEQFEIGQPELEDVEAEHPQMSNLLSNPYPTPLEDEDDPDEIVRKIISEIHLALSMQMGRQNYDEKVASSLHGYMKYITPTARTTSSKYLKKSKLSRDLNLDQSLDANISPSISQHGAKFSVIKPIFLGDRQNGTSENRRQRGCVIRPDEIQTDESTVSSVSVGASLTTESVEILNFNVAHALERGQAHNISQGGYEAEISPAQKKQGKSDRSALRTTGKDVNVLHQLAARGETLSEEDVGWLKEKFIQYKWKVTNLLVGEEEIKKIADTFKIISKIQEIQETVIKSLTTSIFTKHRAPMYDLCRVNILETVYCFAKRNHGNLPDKIRNILIKFQGHKEMGCTAGMDNWILSILKMNEDNVETQFQFWLNQITSLNGGDGLPYDPRDWDDGLSFIRQQVRLPGRCRALEMSPSTKFFHRLLKIITNRTHYAPRIRIKVAEIVEDYLELDLRDLPSLSTEWVDCFVDLYDKCSETTENVSDQFEGEERSSVRPSPLTPPGPIDLDPILTPRHVETTDSSKQGVLWDRRTPWSPEEVHRMRTCLIRSIILIWDRKTEQGDVQCRLSNKAIQFLVRLSTQNADPKLEALIVAALGKLIQRKGDPVWIPGTHRMSYKLLLHYVIDSKARLMNPEEETEAVAHGDGQDWEEPRPPTSSVYVSAIVAQIFLHTISSFSSKEFEEEETTRCLADAVLSSRDPMTRLLCTRCLFLIARSMRQPFVSSVVDSLQAHIFEQAEDLAGGHDNPKLVQIIYGKAAYCLAMEKSSLHHQPISSKNLNQLVSIYSFTPITLDDEDYSIFINKPIIKVLAMQASLEATFEDDIFQLFSRILKAAELMEEAEDSKVILNILINYLKVDDNHDDDHDQNVNSRLPAICLQAVETVFMCSSNGRNDDLFHLSLKILTHACTKQGASLSIPVLEKVLERTRLENDQLSSDALTMYWILVAAHESQELPDHIFRHVDLELTIMRILSHVNLLEGSNPLAWMNDHDQVHLKLLEVSKNIFGQLNIQGDQGRNQLTAATRATLKYVVELYLLEGQTFSPLSLFVLETCLSLPKLDGQIKTDIVQCLILTAENGQCLSPPLIHAAFDVVLPQGDLSLGSPACIPLSLALLHNQQSLPDTVINGICGKFWEQNLGGGAIGGSKVKRSTDVLHKAEQDVLPILVKLAQNNQPLPKTMIVAKKLCRCFNLPKNKALRPRILTALAALTPKVQNSGASQPDMDTSLLELKKIFMTALKSKVTAEFDEGLQGLVSIHWPRVHRRDAKLSDTDIQLLLSTQIDPTVNPSRKEKIANFLYSNRESLPMESQAAIGLSKVDDDDHHFVRNMQMVLHLSFVQLLKREKVQVRFQKILRQENGQSVKLVTSILKIIDSLTLQPHNSGGQLADATFDAVGFALVNNGGMNEIKELCGKIFERIVTANGLSTHLANSLLKYLLIDSSYFFKIILKISQQPDIQPSTELRSTLQVQKLLSLLKHKEQREEDIGEIVLNFFAAHQTVHPSSILDKESFAAFLSLDPSILQSSPAIANFVAAHIIQHDLDSPYLREKAAHIIEQAVHKFGLAVDPIIFTVCPLILSKYDIVPQLTTLESMAKLMTNPQCPYWTQLTILRSLMTVSMTGSGRCSLPPKVVKILVDNVTSEVALVRQMSFAALKGPLKRVSDTTKGGWKGWVTQLENLLSLSSSSSDEYPDPIQKLFQTLGTYLWNNFQEIFDDKVEAERQLGLDESFNLDLLETLYSLDHRNVRGLRDKPDRKLWTSHLILGNFVQSLADTEDEKLTLVSGLKDVCHLDDSMELGTEWKELIPHLLHRLQHDARMSVGEVVTVVKSLSQLSHSDALQVLQNPDPNWTKLMNEKVVAGLLKSKFGRNTNTLNSKIMVDRFIPVIGDCYDFASRVLAKLSQIDDSDSFQFLLDIFELSTNPSELAEIPFKVLGPEYQVPSDMTSKQMKAALSTELLMRDIDVSWDRIKKSRLEASIHSLMLRGVSMAQVKELLELTAAENDKQPSPLCLHIMFQANQFQLDYTVFTDVLYNLRRMTTDLRTVSNCGQLVHQKADLNQPVNDPKPLSAILEEFQRNNPHISFDTMTVQKKIERIGFGMETSVLTSTATQGGKNICLWTEEDIGFWAEQVKSHREKFQGLQMDFKMEALMVTKRAIELTKKYHMNNVQILSCLFALTPIIDLDLNATRSKESETAQEARGCKGQLQEVATGSGKSTIVAVVSVIKALEGFKVDAYTSSSILASRDAREWRHFYQLFKITCADNGEQDRRYSAGEKVCYDQHVVYGDCAQFQFDYLRDHYSGLGTLNGRKCQYAIFDEVDSMFIDDSSKIARLSSTLPGMDLLQVLYHMIWKRLLYIRDHFFQIGDQTFYAAGQVAEPDKFGVIKYHYISKETRDLYEIANLAHYIRANIHLIGQELEEAQIYPVTQATGGGESNLEQIISNQLKQFVEELISLPPQNQSATPTSPLTGTVKLPKHLQKFALTQIPKWVNSALTAMTFQENVHYVIKDGKINPVDFLATGVIHESTNWNHGLHQFLQIKHSLKVTTETVTTNFLSNMAMFQKYKSNILGFTGTLGSEAGKEFLSNFYKVDLLLFPESYPNQFIRYPDRVLDDDNAWLYEIVQTTLEETSKLRGVLIICESIRKAEQIEAALQKYGDGGYRIKLKLYTSNLYNQGRDIGRIQSGDVIVATNLAGRGTDIKTKDIEKYGGLHVCLTFLPETLRVEKQAFGRTSRQQNKGTGQLIVVQPTFDGCTVNSNHSNSQQQLSSQRDDAEKAKLENFEKKELKIISKKDILFDKYCQLFREIRTQLIGQYSNDATVVGKVKNLASRFVSPAFVPPTASVMLHAVEERWAMFLREIENVELTMAQKKYKQFENDLKEDLRTNNLLQKLENCFYLIQLGNYEYAKDGKIYYTLPAADQYYQQAIEMDPDFAAPALVGRASILLKGEVKLLRDERHSEGYKAKATEFLQKAIPLLEDEIGQLSVMQTFVEEQSEGGIKSDLFQQLLTKTMMAGDYLNQVKATLSTIKKSLRQVLCTGTLLIDKNMVSVSNILSPENMELRTFPRGLEACLKYDLTFHDLTVWEDQGTRDQAIMTLKKAHLPLEVRVICPNVDLQKILEKTELLKEPSSMRLDLELGSMDLDADYVVADHASIKCKVYSIQIWADVTVTNLLAMAMKEGTSEYYKAEICQELADQNVGSQIRSQLLHESDVKRRAQVDRFGHISSVKFIELESWVGVVKILNLVKSLAGTTLLHTININMTVHELEKNVEVLLKAWHLVFCKFEKNNLILSQLTEDSAPPVIKALRVDGTEFLLQCTNLTPDSARALLLGADICQEQMEQTSLKRMVDSFESVRQRSLVELGEFVDRGYAFLVIFNEKGFFPWRSATCICVLAGLQATVGAVLISTGFGVTVGMGLIAEGMADFVTAHGVYTSRKFSWSTYGKQKAISLVISASCAGLSSMKEGFKATRLAFQGVVREAAEETTILAGTKMVSMAGVQASKEQLTKLALKHLAVSTVETSARIGLNSMANAFASFTFEQLRSIISGEVDKFVKSNFFNPTMSHMLSRLYAVQKYGNPRSKASEFWGRIHRAVQTATNPASSFWSRQWEAVGKPLCLGILGDPQYLGSIFSLTIRAFGVIVGMKEICTIVGKVCEEISKQLTPEAMTTMDILEQLCHVPIDTDSLASQLIFSPPHNFKLTTPLQSSSNHDSAAQMEAVQNCFTQLHNLETSFGPSDPEVGAMIQCVVDLITSHIIRTADSQLVLPWTSFVVGNVVSASSNYVQRSVCVLNDGQTPATIRQQIEEADQMLAGRRLEVLTRTQLMKQAADGGQPITRMSVDTINSIIDITDGKPADLPTMVTMAESHGLKLKIVQDQNYQLTPQDVDDGARLVVCEQIDPDPDSPMRYKLRRTDGGPNDAGKFVDINCVDADSGYATIGHLTGDTSIGSLRVEASEQILNDPSKFQKVKQASQWMSKHCPSPDTLKVALGALEGLASPMGPGQGGGPGQNQGADGQVVVMISAPKTEIVGEVLYTLGKWGDDEEVNLIQKIVLRVPLTCSKQAFRRPYFHGNQTILMDDGQVCQMGQHPLCAGPLRGDREPPGGLCIRWARSLCQLYYDRMDEHVERFWTAHGGNNVMHVYFELQIGYEDLTAGGKNYTRAKKIQADITLVGSHSIGPARQPGNPEVTNCWKEAYVQGGPVDNDNDHDDGEAQDRVIYFT